MIVSPTGFSGLYILEPKVFEDPRGYFMETYNQKVLRDFDVKHTFVQDNQSSSRKGVLRGMHFQNSPYAQTKLIRVLRGTILDIVVDLRRNEDTFSRTFAVELSHENKKQLLVPKGFAHGFAVLSDQAEVFYKCDQFYNPIADGGINFLDPALEINGILPSLEFILSDKDKKLPLLHELESTKFEKWE